MWLTSWKFKGIMCAAEVTLILFPCYIAKYHQIYNKTNLKDSIEQNRSSSLEKSAGSQGWKWITVHQFWLINCHWSISRQTFFSGGSLSFLFDTLLFCSYFFAFITFGEFFILSKDNKGSLNQASGNYRENTPFLSPGPSPLPKWRGGRRNRWTRLPPCDSKLTDRS